MKNWIIISLVILSLIGLVDSAYLTSEHYSGGAVICNIGEYTLGDCGTVLTSQYATTFGVPNALVGVLYYFILLVLSALLLSDPRKLIAQLITTVTALGFLASAWFVYLQLFVLNAICVYCMISAVATTALFVLSPLLLRRCKQPSRDTL